jgi:hypothetical protein
VLLRYPALQEVTRSRIGIPASARAKVAAFIHADLVPTKGVLRTYVINIDSNKQEKGFLKEHKKK